LHCNTHPPLQRDWFFATRFCNAIGLPQRDLQRVRAKPETKPFNPVEAFAP